MLIREAGEVDSAAIAKVQVDSWRSTYRGIVPDDHIASLTYEGLEQKWRQFFAAGGMQFTYVAEGDGRHVFGFASGGANRESGETYQGELYAIYLFENHQRRGSGRLLVKAIAKRLLQEGLSSMSVWVLADNPSCAFYARLGGEKVLEKEIVIGGASLVEVAYAWLDLNVLMKDKR